MNENIKPVEIVGRYMEFQATDDPDQARKTFQDRFKYEPDEAVIIGWRMYVGPVREG